MLKRAEAVQPGGNSVPGQLVVVQLAVPADVALPEPVLHFLEDGNTSGVNRWLLWRSGVGSSWLWRCGSRLVLEFINFSTRGWLAKKALATPNPKQKRGNPAEARNTARKTSG